MALKLQPTEGLERSMVDAVVRRLRSTTFNVFLMSRHICNELCMPRHALRAGYSLVIISF